MPRSTSNATPLEAPLSSMSCWDKVPSGVTNPTYVVMNEDDDGSSSGTSLPTNFSDTDSITFLEKTAPDLLRDGVRRSSSKKLPPSRFPHVYEDVPEHILEKNRQMVGNKDIFDSVSFSSPLVSEQKRRSSGSSDSAPTYDVPRRSLPEADDIPMFHVQRQLSASGVFYDFPGYRSSTRKPSVRADAKGEEGAPVQLASATYDVPPGLASPSPLSRGDVAHNDLYDFPICSRTTPTLFKCDSFSEDGDDVSLLADAPSPPPLLQESSTKENAGSPPQAFLGASTENPAFRASYAYEVPKPRPVLVPARAPLSFPPPPPVDELNDIPAVVPPARSMPLAIPECCPDDWEEYDVPMSPPPSYPPPPPPVLGPPAVPPRKVVPASLPRAREPEGPPPGFRPVPAKRYSLARQSPVHCLPPPASSEEKCSDRAPVPTLEAATSPTDSPVFGRAKKQLSQHFSKSSLSSSSSVSPGRSSSPSQCSLLGGFDSPASECSFPEPGRKCGSSRAEQAVVHSSSESLPSMTRENGAEVSDDEPCSKTVEGTSLATAMLGINSAKWNAERDFAGYIYKTETKRKGFLKRWCTLRDGCWSYFVSEKDSLPLGSLSAEDIAAVSVSGSGPNPATSNCPELWCFEIHALQSQGCRFLIGVPDALSRRQWVGRLGAVVVPGTSFASAAEGSEGDVLHVGRLHVKEGTSGFRRSVSACLRGRELHLREGENAAEVLDLRKVMSVGKPEDTSLLAPRESGPSFQLQLPGRALYLHADQPRHTESWASSIRNAWVTPTDGQLSSQYLTSDGVPVSVDRCINFVSTYGTMLTGIYRLAGSSSKVKKLVNHMLQDPWTLHLTTEEYTPHDVANALKRYLRSFSDCLLTRALFPRWIEVSKCEHPAERKKLSKNLLEELPPVNYQLLKKLVSHLKSISDHSDRNYMPVLNLAPVFGPSLLYGDAVVGSVSDISSHGGSFEESNASMDIVADLIQDYCWFFEVDPEEIVKEKKIQEALDMFRDAKIAQRPAGDMLVGVYVYSRDWGHCFNVKLSPAMTAGHLCHHVVSQLSIKEPSHEMAVFEVICNQDLERPLHHSELVLSCVLRWAVWDVSYAKDNFLCIKNNYVYQEISPLIMSHQPLSVFSELRYANPRQKSFKKAHFEFTGGKITHHKDSKRSAEASHHLNQWNIEDITWYMGCDSRRNPPHRMNVTFAARQGEMKRSKETPYFGNCLSLSSEEEFTRWLAAMLIAEFPSGILPPTTSTSDVAS